MMSIFVYSWVLLFIEEWGIIFKKQNINFLTKKENEIIRDVLAEEYEEVFLEAQDVRIEIQKIRNENTTLLDRLERSTFEIDVF